MLSFLKKLLQGRLPLRSTRMGEAASLKSQLLFAANSARRDLNFLIDAAANDFRPDEEGWVQISPYGSYRHKKGIQVFEKEDAELMVQAFKAGNNKTLAEKWYGIPIYVGHPDASTDFKDDKAYGYIKELAAKNDGLYGRIKLNKFGKEIVEEAVYNSHSPYWRFEPDPKRHGVIRPRELISTGFTNSPNIRDTRPFAANEEEETDMNELLKKIALMLALGEAANEADVTAKLTTVLAAANELPTVKTKLTETETKVTKLTDDLAAANASVTTVKGELTAANGKATVLAGERDTAANALAAERAEREKMIVDAAINSGAITQAEKPTVEAELKAAKELTAFNSVATRVMTKASSLFMKSMAQGRTAANGMTKPGWAKFHSAVNEMTAKGKKREVAWNECKGMDEHKALFAEEQKA